MKILKERSRRYKEQDYYKYKINIPEIVLHGAKLKAGDELEVETKDKMIILRKKGV